MNLKCVVIDDEQYAIEAIVSYIDRMPGLTLFQTFSKPTQALTEIKSIDDIGIIFLDIEMPELSGLELAKSLREKTKFLIFTTGHSKHALTAFHLNVDQYLLKPITFAQFALTIDYLAKSTMQISAISPADQPFDSSKNNFQFVKADQRNAYYYIDPLEITHIQAARNYVIIYTLKEQYTTHMGLNHIEAALSKDHFIRIGKSYIIAKAAIKKIEGHSIKLKNNEVFQLGDVYKAAFVAFMKQDMMKLDPGTDFQLLNEK